jgi:hypothetical protein
MESIGNMPADAAERRRQTCIEERHLVVVLIVVRLGGFGFGSLALHPQINELVSDTVTPEWKNTNSITSLGFDAGLIFGSLVEVGLGKQNEPH